MIVAGFHVPLMPLVDVVGRLGAVAPTQRSAIGSNVGVTWSVIVTSRVVVSPHASSGVNV